MLKTFRRGLTRDTYVLSFTSLFSDVASEMLYPILPTFFTEVLGASAGTLAAIEGLANGTQYVAQGPAGWFADRMRSPKRLAAGGFLVSALSKPFIGVAAVWPQALAGRLMDRLGAGARSAPRDAMVATSATEEARGRAFGVESLGDNLGAFAGPLVCALLLFVARLPIRAVFYIAVVPALASVALVLLVRDQPPDQRAPGPGQDGRRLPSAFFKYLGAVAIFGLGNATNALIILRAQNLGLTLAETLLLYAGFNLCASLASLPAGFLSDRLGERRSLIGAYGVFFLVYVAFAIGGSIVAVGLLLVAFGVFQGMHRTVGKALAARLSGHGSRGTGLGLYSATVGLTGLVASIAGGQLWDRVAPAATFWYGAGCALLGILALTILVSDPAREPG